MRKIEQLSKNQEKFGINFKHHVQHLETPTGRLNLKVSGKRKKILDFSWTSASDTGSTTTSHLQGKIERFLRVFLKDLSNSQWKCISIYPQCHWRAYHVTMQAVCKNKQKKQVQFVSLMGQCYSYQKTLQKTAWHSTPGSNWTVGVLVSLKEFEELWTHDSFANSFWDWASRTRIWATVAPKVTSKRRWQSHGKVPRWYLRWCH